MPFGSEPVRLGGLNASASSEREFVTNAFRQRAGSAQDKTMRIMKTFSGVTNAFRQRAGSAHVTEENRYSCDSVTNAFRQRAGSARRSSSFTPYRASFCHQCLSAASRFGSLLS